MAQSDPMDRALSVALKARIRGQVNFDRAARALYATDASNYRQVPIGVVLPLDEEDVIQTVGICRDYDVPILARGAGTSVAGQCCNAAVIMDMSRHMNRILEIDPANRSGRVQPGVVLDKLRDAAEEFGLTFGPDPATHNRCTLGGMIGNNSCGVHSVMAGNTVDNIDALDILTYDGFRIEVGPTSNDELSLIVSRGDRRGEIYAALQALRDKYADLIRERFPVIPRRVSGYNLDQLLPENGFNVARALVGTEGTCVTLLSATTRLVYSPPARVLVVIGFPDIYTAADYVPGIMAFKPVGLEGMDDHLVECARRKGILTAERALLPNGKAWLLVEFGGNTRHEAVDLAYELMVDLSREINSSRFRLFDDPKEAGMVWKIRESALGVLMRIPGERDNWEGWEDAAVHPEKLGPYLREFRQLLDKYGYRGALYGHFGQGCVHNRIDFDFKTAAGVETFRAFLNEAADLVASYGGSLSGEHGDGQSRAEFLPKMFGSELVNAFREFKTIWDPQGRMNPGKIVDPYRADENLRVGLGYRPWQPPTHFQFPEDNGSFAHATLRCIGVGACRREEGGTMCPSYMVTREEKYSTRGRAHLLFEMFQGEVITDRWRNEDVKEALDLCLACKACKSECPVKVDMATYKAEFLSHYYHGRLRPMASLTMGLIYWWARLGARLPRAVNLVTQTRLLRDVVKAIGGIAPQRKIPALAHQTFKSWFRKRTRMAGERTRVILWPDTFNNHFHPEVAEAAVEVLEGLGYRVEVPQQSFCCGRPLYDWGMLSLAKHMLRRILNGLKHEIAEGVPIIVLEPSCAAVFRDELVNLFPNDGGALRLSQRTFLLSEFLEKELKTFQPLKLSNKSIVHGHCHQTALMGMIGESAILTKLGLDFKLLDSGCCGMAGAFGFQKDHYQVSIQAGERVLLPAVREADESTLVITNGFSCREQIEQVTGKGALHLAQVLRMAMRDGEN
jgi:FAD/FMN-containing dehydrogenase/Fe-S oxidoreductase